MGFGRGFYAVSSGGGGSSLALVTPRPAAIATPTGDPSSALVSATQDAAGWITATVDTTAPAGGFVNQGVWWTLAAEDILGNAYSGDPWQAQIGFVLEVDNNNGDADLGCAILLGDIGGGTNPVGIAMWSDGTGWQVAWQGQGGTYAVSGSFESTTRRCVGEMAHYIAIGQIRGAAAIALDSSDTYVDAASSITIVDVENIGTLDDVTIALFTPATGGAGGTNQQIRFRARTWIYPYADMLGAYSP